MNPFRTSQKIQEIRPQNPYFSKQTCGVCLQNIYDYSPFGVSLDGRTIEGDFYRCGFNGMEKDDEVKGKGNSYTTEFRQLDQRLGRWLSLDPLMFEFPFSSPYVSFDNNPIFFTDPSGLNSINTNGDGDTKTVKGAGGSTIILPERAKIISKLKDYGGDGKIDYKGKVFEAKDGDLEKFSIDGDIYSVTWNTDGTYRGYYNSEGKRYTNVEKIIIEEAGYIPPPKSLPGFPGATKTKPVGGRPRWINPDGDVLEWDKQHGDIERYNKQGNKHKGSYDPETGKKTKEPVPGRKTTKPMLDNPVDYEIVTQKPRIDIPPPDPVIIITFEGVLLIGIILLAPIGL
jgi:RHS repeat-associated protein